MAHVGVAGMRGLIGRSEGAAGIGCASGVTGGSDGKLAC